MALSRRRLLLGFVILVMLIFAAAWVAVSQWLDPGDKGDTSTDLVTPTIAAQTARVFDVSPDESQVDFVTQVRGIEVSGVFPVEAGTITLEPVGDELRVLVRLDIDVDHVDTGQPAIDRVLRGAMSTGDYPLAFYAASSQGLVPVTEDEIEFMLTGDLEVHNVTDEHGMSVSAQLVGGDMWAVATSELDLANHGVNFPSFFGTTVIQLTARLQAYEVQGIENGAS